MENKSNIEIVYDLISSRNGGVTFKEIWTRICELNGYSEAQKNSKIGEFYTTLTLDGRFILIDNKWDLRSRHKYEEYSIEKTTVVLDDDEEDRDIEEMEDEEKKELGLDDGDSEEKSEYEPDVTDEE
jgi:DNA-directed RNA polymerase subunit delta